jgi:hypothetical protein
MRVPICERSAANGSDIVAELVTGGDRPDDNPFAVAAKEDALQRAATQLRARGFKVEMLEDGEAARTRIVELVPAGAFVYTGTRETLRVSGIDADLNASGRYDAIKPRTYTMDRATQAKEIRRLISSPDVVVGSVVRSPRPVPWWRRRPPASRFRPIRPVPVRSSLSSAPRKLSPTWTPPWTGWSRMSCPSRMRGHWPPMAPTAP